MSIDVNVCETERYLSQGRDPTEFEEEVLGALEDMDAARKEIDRTRTVLAAALGKVMLFCLPKDSVVDMWDRRWGRIRVVKGSAHGGTKFRIDSAPFVDVNTNIPMFTEWMATATPLNSAGNPMKNPCRIRGRVFPKADAPSQEKLSENDRIMKAVEEYEEAVYQSSVPSGSVK